MAVYHDLISELAAKDIDSPRLEARLMLAEVLQDDATSAAILNAELSEKQQNQLKELVARRTEKHEPLDKILGHKAFYKYDFWVTNDVLSPRPDTEILVEEALRLCPETNTAILDLGTGSGCILLSLLKEKSKAQGVGVDISVTALETAHKNAERLIDEGKADITGVITTRDDIMTYLIDKGVESSEAFSIMENVRKGKVAKHKVEDKWKVWKEDMLACDVPEWYIWSCEQIQYMFPKAHAAAYVTMGWRVAYYKVYYPLAYYAAYFSIRATKFSYETMCNGLQFLRQNMQFLQSLPKMSKTEEDTLDDMRLVEEFYVRGFEFTPIDLKVVKPDKFQIIDGKLMPSLKSIEGIADTAAKNIVEGCRDASFTSQADLKKKCKIGDAVVDKLVGLGIIKDLPKSDQLSIFDI